MIHLSSPKTRCGLVLGLAVSLFFCSTNASAQDYIGGSISFSNTTINLSTAGTSTNTFSFSIAPDLGWELGEKWAVGIRPTLGFSRSGDGSLRTQKLSLGVNPYARYKVLAINRFGLLAEGNTALSFIQTSTGNGEEYSRKSKTTNYGIRILPVLTYQIGNHVSLETRLNIFSLSMFGYHNDDYDNPTNDSFACSLGASSEDIFGSLGDITVGFLYHF